MTETAGKLRFLPTTCEHGVPIDPQHFGPSIDENLLNFYIPECKDANKNLKAHSINPEWPEDTSRYSGRELALGAGQRKPRSDRGVKRGPRK